MALTNRADRVLDMMDELIDREEQFSTFLNASPWGIIVVDVTFHITYANNTFLEMTGYDYRDIIGNHIQSLMPKEDRKRHSKHEKAYVKAPHSRTGNHGLEPRILKKDGSVIDVEISISPTRVKGQRMFFASVRPLETLFHTVDGQVKGT